MPEALPAARGTVVIGVGNPIMGDDGFGLAALQRLEDEWLLPEDVRLIDGGTWGLTLLPDFESAHRVLFLDAIDTGAAPGTHLVVERDALPRALAMHTSPHQVDLSDLLALARLRGTLPEHIVAIGAQPLRVEMSTELSAPLEAALDATVLAAVARLELWGHPCTPRTRTTSARLRVSFTGARPVHA
jgi:hydrogenase maturation protease